MSVSVPALIAFSASEYAIYVESATAQIVLGVVISSIVSPILAVGNSNIHIECIKFNPIKQKKCLRIFISKILSTFLLSCL
ncbi:2-keto-3-deoxygluconate permease [Ruoffia tabacinasalis]|uniref:2-keto-3-deoxygluconate permease n=1 Tax=Ruoffia tabacinasalis TaxID=87458 RepID=UPI003CC82493